MRALFVIGTGTDVGKTFVTALMVKKLYQSGRSAAYFKAAMSGNSYDAEGHLIPGDALFVKNAAGLTQPLSTMCPYVYEAAVSPHLAARLEGNPVSLDCVRESFEYLSASYDFITIEGSGGIVCPLRFDDEHKVLLEDIIAMLDLPLLLVADAGLGTINSVILTVSYLQMKKYSICGMVLNRFHPGNVMEEDNLKMCQTLTGLPVLTCIEEGSTEFPMELDALIALYK